MIIRKVSGRMQEEVNKLTDDQRQRAALKFGLRLGDDDTLKVFPNRKAMAKLIRKEEEKAPRSHWNPIVKLKDNEGYS